MNVLSLAGTGKVLGAPIKAGEVVGAGTQALKDIATLPVTAAKAVGTGVKNVAVGAKNVAKGAVTSPFQDTYLAHSLSNKTINKALNANTFTKLDETGVKVTTSPLDTLEKFDARPTVESTPGGFKLNTEKWQAEATTKQRAFDDKVTNAAKENKTPVTIKELKQKALNDAMSDKELTDSPAREASVRNELTNLFKIYAGKSETIDAKTLNRFRIGANKEAQSYFDAQNTAAAKGAPPRITADTAKAYEIMASVFRDHLAKIVPESDALLTQERAMINANRYATSIHLSPVGPGMMGKTAAEVAVALAGNALPGGPITGAAAGYGLEKAFKYATEQKYTNYKPSGLRNPTNKTTIATPSNINPIEPKPTIPLPKGQGGALNTPKVVEEGLFGPVYVGVKGQDAVSHLLNVKKGEVRGAFNRTDIGKIDLVWDEGTGKGLKYIESEHADVLPHLQEIVEKGNILSKTSNRIRLTSKIGSKKGMAVVRLDFDGKSKTWLLTGFLD